MALSSAWLLASVELNVKSLFAPPQIKRIPPKDDLRQPGGLLVCRSMTLRPHLAVGLPFRVDMGFTTNKEKANTKVNYIA